MTRWWDTILCPSCLGGTESCKTSVWRHALSAVCQSSPSLPPDVAEAALMWPFSNRIMTIIFASHILMRFRIEWEKKQSFNCTKIAFKPNTGDKCWWQQQNFNYYYYHHHRTPDLTLLYFRMHFLILHLFYGSMMKVYDHHVTKKALVVHHCMMMWLLWTYWNPYTPFWQCAPPPLWLQEWWRPPQGHKTGFGDDPSWSGDGSCPGD